MSICTIKKVTECSNGNYRYTLELSSTIIKKVGGLKLKQSKKKYFAIFLDDDIWSKDEIIKDFDLDFFDVDESEYEYKDPDTGEVSMKTQRVLLLKE